MYDKIGKIALIGVLISVSIEIVQMFGCGATGINDLITNTIGACLGEGSQCVFELVIFWICTLLIMITIQPQIYHALFAAGGAGGEIQMWN